MGERLDHLLTAALAQGATAAVVMDSDSPTLPVAYVSEAFARLAEGADVVLGPCDDGGYYLIGLKQPQPRLPARSADEYADGAARHPRDCRGAASACRPVAYMV